MVISPKTVLQEVAVPSALFLPESVQGEVRGLINHDNKGEDKSILLAVLSGKYEITSDPFLS